MANASRILLCGDVGGSFALLGKFLKRIQDRQGPFAAIVCCGAFFGQPDDNRNDAHDAGDECGSSSIKKEREEGDVTEEAGRLLSLLRQRYGQQMKALASLSGSLPFPLFFIDEEVACLAAQVATSTGPAPVCQEGDSHTENGLGESGILKDHQDAPSSRDVDEATGSIEAESGSPRRCEKPSSSTGTLVADLSVDASGALTPVQLFRNVYWLGAAGFARVAGLNVAFFGMPESDANKGHKGEMDEKEGKTGGDDNEAKTRWRNGADSPSLADPTSVKRRRLDEEKAEAVGGGPSVPTSDDMCQSHPSSLSASGCVPFLRPSSSSSPPCTSSANALRQMIDVGESPAWRGRIDLLLSSRWPEGIWRGLCLPGEQNEKEEEFNQLLAKAQVALGDLEARNSGSTPAQLAAFLEPRYVIAASAGLFYPRPAFRGVRFGYTMKFIALGTLGSKEPERKPIHALQLTPLDEIRAALFPALARADASADSANTEKTGDSPSLTADEAETTLFALPPDATCNPISSLLPPDRKLCGGSGDAVDVLERMSSATLRRELLRSAQCLDDDSANPPATSFPQPNHGRPFGPRRNPEQKVQGPPRRCCVVCVSNLTYDVDDQSLERVMGAFGEVKFIYAPRNPENKSQGTGKAFVVYFAPEGAEKAVEASGQLEAGRRVLRVAMWREKIPFAHKIREDGVPPPPKPGSSIVTKPHADCWFCLANPKVEKHLVASVGDTCYVAAPKGGVHALHALIIPITHFPSVAFATEEVRAEIGRYVQAYRRALRQKENLDCIVYERYVPMRTTKAMHTQIQCIPCSRAEGLRAVEFFKKRAHKAGLSFESLPSERNALAFSDLASRAPGTEIAYFYIELPGLSTASGQLVERFLTAASCRVDKELAMEEARYSRRDFI
ncbi:hypothetical protein NCLIV_041390 [Neospora caninum Liverpool]|uniref:RRM domain-containing protein n=1 Tax=Neospora caninum (strain Liverpool) TaxID=572307 RepID=F0VBT0_NEOCL|nr:hypothetical protein NCLIV_041390 [Neospora caninum Liverpool]CBZ51064.1 hypothetical protein NCLIV_041390 [Neospora caninum Liverpool]|eukprot:XP_003881097.1 hypothetical protein NCLIV_041390 [Neospora caninum Liverpool]